MSDSKNLRALWFQNQMGWVSVKELEAQWTTYELVVFRRRCLYNYRYIHTYMNIYIYIYVSYLAIPFLLVLGVFFKPCFGAKFDMMGQQIGA